MQPDGFILPLARFMLNYVSGYNQRHGNLLEIQEGRTVKNTLRIAALIAILHANSVFAASGAEGAE